MRLIMLAVATLLPTLAAGDAMSFTISSPAFADKAGIPKHQSCEGDDTSPALRWSALLEAMKGHVPAEAQLVGTYQKGQ